VQRGFDESCLSRAVWAEDAEYFSLLDFEVDFLRASIKGSPRASDGFKDSCDTAHISTCSDRLDPVEPQHLYSTWWGYLFTRSTVSIGIS